MSEFKRGQVRVVSESCLYADAGALKLHGTILCAATAAAETAQIVTIRKIRLSISRNGNSTPDTRIFGQGFGAHTHVIDLINKLALNRR
jgi:hypothetical protein